MRRLSASGLNAEKSRRPARGAAASAQLTKVTVGNNAISGNGLPAWMARAAKPEDFTEMRFTRELDESGFIDDLYKSRKR